MWRKNRRNFAIFFHESGNTGKRFKRKTTAISEAFSMDFYKGSDWIIPDTLSESLLKEPEASSLKVYDSDSICRKQVDGVERCFTRTH